MDLTTNTTRGYSMVGCLAFIHHAYPPEAVKAIIEQLPPDVQAAIEGYNKVEWYPWRHFTSFLHAIANSQPTEELARAHLVRCGNFIAEDATNTFLRLAMKILTPGLFAKKIPEFWKRDNRGGAFEMVTLDAAAGKMTLRLTGVAGFDHIGPVASGWVTFGLQSMGKKLVAVNCHPWSLAAPGPDALSIDVTWG